MKTKILLLNLFIVSVLGAQAQTSMKFYSQDKSTLYLNGDTVCVTHAEANGDSEFPFQLKNETNTTDYFILEKQNMSLPEGIVESEATAMCTEMCFSASVNKSPEFETNAASFYTAGNTHLVYYSKNVKGYATVKLTVYPTDRTNDVRTLFVVYAIDTTPIVITPKTTDPIPVGTANKNGITVESKFYPNPVANQLNIEYAKTINGEVLIKNTLGVTVAKAIISDNQITMDVTSLKKGIYTCTTTSDNEIVNTFKFVK